MCGIIGIVGTEDVVGRILEGLKRLEYRGYDSAGVATLAGGAIERRRAEGRIGNLEDLLRRSPIHGSTGIGHTRWATHGRPNEINAHPHATQKVAVVHNGIIENFKELRAELTAAGHVFTTDTDTEAIAHLLTALITAGKAPETAMIEAMNRLKGAFSLGVVFADWPDMIAGARRGSPLAVGFGDGEMFLGSDAMALAPFTSRISFLEEDDWAIVTRDNSWIYHDGERVRREIRQIPSTGSSNGKGEYSHFMMKEIAEQPAAIARTLGTFMVDAERRSIQVPHLPVDLSGPSRLSIVGCGTAFLAGCVGKYWFEQAARVPVDVDIASEFRYRGAPLEESGVTIAISQSGETADTLAALRYARAEGQAVLAILNAPSSTIGREANAVLPTLAGPEIGVASTKAFTAQLTVLAALAIAAARTRGTMDEKDEQAAVQALLDLPHLIAQVLSRDSAIRSVAHELAGARDVLFLGRGTSYPIALEGALKLKEISYIHAEGYAAGEMKHGPIALIDKRVPVVVIAPSGDLFDKTASNLQEVRARGGRVVLLSDAEGIRKLRGDVASAIELPAVHPFVAPILYAVPVQLLAYHAAVARGTDVDKPRNLAKSVTVE
jgi:glucosamine--fructose-6-phosphate aminotransferase (isomerizing)